MSNSIDIQGLNKVDLLEALWEGSKTQGYLSGIEVKFNRKEASEAVLKSIDYFCGKPIKCDLSNDSFDPWLYDRDVGKGKAAKIVQDLRNKSSSHVQNAK